MIHLLVLALTFALAPSDTDWSRFRGPNGSGISSDTGFPTEFNKSKNLLWRTAVRPGKSSPVLTRRHVFLTAHDNGKLFTQCFDRETGKLLWERSVGRAQWPCIDLCIRIDCYECWKSRQPRLTTARYDHCA